MQSFIGGSSGYNSGGSLSELTKSGADKYPNPFFDIASEYMPSTIYEMFSMVEFLWNTMPPFAEVGKKVSSYFVTDFEFEGGTDNERKDIESLFKKDMKLKDSLIACARDLLVYGQSLVSVYIPFSRYLRCPDCDSSYKLDKIKYTFHATPGDPHFTARCHKCADGNKRFNLQDVPSKDRKRIKLVRWSPKTVTMAVHPISGRRKVCIDFQRIPRFQQLVREGNLSAIMDTPWDMVKTICEGGTKLFELDEKMIHYMGEQPLAGMDEFKAWAIPPLLSCFKLAFYINLLRRYDEAFVMDFIIPFRVMYPDVPSAGEPNPLTGMPMTDFVSRLKHMVDRKRKNITDIQIAPFKIGYQLMGGEGKAMSPKDNINQAMEELLNACGYPAELYNSNIQFQVAPIALRLFERRWIHLVDGLNTLVAWVLDIASGHFGWSKDVTAKLRSVTMADDLERKAITLQAAAGGDLSKTTAYGQFGIDFKEEQRRALQEQAFIEKLTREHQEEMEISQMAGGEGGGEPGEEGSSPGYNITMDDLRGEAQDLAEQLLFQVPEGQRRGQLINIKNTNPTLHALVIQALTDLRQSMASEGQSMLIEEQRQMAMQGGNKQAGALDSLVTIEKRATLDKRPSPTYIRMLVLEQGEHMDRDYLRKVASKIRTEEDKRVFSTIMNILDPTRRY